MHQTTLDPGRIYMNFERNSYMSDNFEKLVDAKIDLEATLENFTDQGCWCTIARRGK